ncbi:MAG: NigD-like C-terminal domain-containing protein [Prolixibacteraceae bacterium]
MKTRFLYILFLFLFLMSGSCDEQTEITQPVCKKYIQLSFLDYNRMKEDPYQISEAKLSGDCLIITLKYSGGCKDHQVDLALILPECATPPLPVPTFEIRHNANDDLCEALITKEYSFDISGIKEAGKTQTGFILAEKNAQGQVSATTPFLYQY